MEILHRLIRSIHETTIDSRVIEAKQNGQTADIPQNRAAVDKMLSPTGLAWSEIPNKNNTVIIKKVNLTGGSHSSTNLCSIKHTGQEGPLKDLIAVDLRKIWGSSEEINLKIVSTETKIVVGRYTTNVAGEIHRQIFDITGKETRQGRQRGPVFFDKEHIGILNISHRRAVGTPDSITPNRQTELVYGLNLEAEISNWGIRSLKFPSRVIPIARTSYRCVGRVVIDFA